MAAPTAPTTTTISTEALKKAGYSSPSAAQLTRAWDYWGNEIKNDIWSLVKDLKSMQTQTVIGLSEGLSRYSFPADFSKLSLATLMEGSNTGVCQAGGSTTTAKLASTIGVSDDYIIGKEVMVYLTATPTTAYISQCTSFNETTKVATVSPAWTPSPDTTYSYIVVDTYHPLKINPIWERENENYPTDKHRPISIHPIGDSDYGEFLTFQSPDKTYGLKLFYYADLTTIDEAGTLHGTILNRWRNVFIQGIFAKQLQDDDDDRASAEMAKYQMNLQSLILREKYGMDLSNLQTRLS